MMVRREGRENSRRWQLSLGLASCSAAHGPSIRDLTREGIAP
jgi:hypothetical protein